MVKEKPLITADFLTAYPGYYDSFREILQILVSKGGIYVPEEVEYSKHGETRRLKFETGLLGILSREWRDSDIPTAWDFRRARPIQMELNIGKTPGGPFELLFLFVETSHFEKIENVQEFLGVLKEYLQYAASRVWKC